MSIQEMIEILEKIQNSKGNLEVIFEFGDESGTFGTHGNVNIYEENGKVFLFGD